MKLRHVLLAATLLVAPLVGFHVSIKYPSLLGEGHALRPFFIVSSIVLAIAAKWASTYRYRDISWPLTWFLGTAAAGAAIMAFTTRVVVAPA